MMFSRYRNKEFQIQNELRFHISIRMFDLFFYFMIYQRYNNFCNGLNGAFPKHMQFYAFDIMHLRYDFHIYCAQCIFIVHKRRQSNFSECMKILL